MIASSSLTSAFALVRSEEHTFELQSLRHLVCRLLLEKKKKKYAKSLCQLLYTPASAQAIPSFTSQPNFHVDVYFVVPSGWLTFNQFFSCKVTPTTQTNTLSLHDTLPI